MANKYELISSTYASGNAFLGMTLRPLVGFGKIDIEALNKESLKHSIHALKLELIKLVESGHYKNISTVLLSGPQLSNSVMSFIKLEEIPTSNGKSLLHITAGYRSGISYTCAVEPTEPTIQDAITQLVVVSSKLDKL